MMMEMMVVVVLENEYTFLMMMMMMMMCNDLMCTYKLTRSQLSLAHSTKLKPTCTRKMKNNWSPWSQFLSCLRTSIPTHNEHQNWTFKTEQ